MPWAEKKRSGRREGKRGQTKVGGRHGQATRTQRRQQQQRTRHAEVHTWWLTRGWGPPIAQQPTPSPPLPKR